jgi:hypothetical protein
MTHYRTEDGHYLGAFDAAPQGGIEVPFAPVDPDRQIWIVNSWQWPVRYFRRADMTYAGACAGPDSDVPGDWIEVPVAPDDARQMWNGESWDALLVETI